MAVPGCKCTAASGPAWVLNRVKAASPDRLAVHKTSRSLAMWVKKLRLMRLRANGVQTRSARRYSS